MNISDRLSNTDGWMYLLIIGFTLLMVFLFFKSIAEFKNTTKSEKQFAAKKVIFIGIVLIVTTFFLFFNFGPGKMHHPTPVEDTGEYKQLQDIDEELDESELKRDAENRKTKELIIQSNDSLREKYLEESEKKSDALVEKYLKL